MNYLYFYICICLLNYVKCLESVWYTTLSQNDQSSYSIFPNYLYKDSFVNLQITCHSKSKDAKIKVTWILEELECMSDMYSVVTRIDKNSVDTRVSDPATGKHRRYQKSAQQYTWECGHNQNIYLMDESEASYYDYISKSGGSILQIKNDTHKMTSRTPSLTNITHTKHPVTKTWADGMYHFLLSVEPFSSEDQFQASVYIEMQGQYGFLPAIKWPLLPYTGIMSLLYLTMGSVWLMTWAYSLSHTQKIHVVIGAITVTGALNHTLNFVELSYTAHSGYIIPVQQWICILFGAAHDSLVHCLLMVVSIGYGLTRPSLHTTMVSCISLVTGYTFVCGCLLKSLSSDQLSKFRYSHEKLFTVIQDIYSISILVVGLWITIFSVMTFHQMATRKHSTKTRKFQFFMVTSMICFIANIGIVIMLTYGAGLFMGCRKDWSHDWIYTSFTSIMNFGLLVLLMLLWRPANEDQSYSFQPLTQEAECEINDSEELEITEFDRCTLTKH